MQLQSLCALLDAPLGILATQQIQDWGWWRSSSYTINLILPPYLDHCASAGLVPCCSCAREADQALEWFWRSFSSSLSYEDSCKNELGVQKLRWSHQYQQWDTDGPHLVLVERAVVFKYARSSGVCWCVCDCRVSLPFAYEKYERSNQRLHLGTCIWCMEQFRYAAGEHNYWLLVSSMSLIVVLTKHNRSSFFGLWDTKLYPNGTKSEVQSGHQDSFLWDMDI